MKPPILDMGIEMIPADALEHVQYLGQFSPIEVWQWMEVWNRSQAQSGENIDAGDRYGRFISHVKSECGGEDPEIDQTISFASNQPLNSSINDPFWTPRSRLSTSRTVKKHIIQQKSTDPTISKPSRKGLPEIYACLFCQKTFGRKGDWKRHEGTLHEVQKEWRCTESGCNRRFFAGNKFRRHHESEHGCDDCRHDSDPKILTSLQTASAWGCGFCVAVLLTWDERVNHIGNHFESGSKRQDWDFSTVIRSLLVQPGICDAWRSLLMRIHGPSTADWPLFEWRLDSCHELVRDLRDLNSVSDMVRTIHLAYQLGQSTAFSIQPKMTPPRTFEDCFLDSEKRLEVGSVETASFDEIQALLNLTNETVKLQTPSTFSVTPVDAPPSHPNSLPEDYNFDEYFIAPNDYMAPCPETFQPTAWFIWPDPLNPFISE